MHELSTNFKFNSWPVKGFYSKRSCSSHCCTEHTAVSLSSAVFESPGSSELFPRNNSQCGLWVRLFLNRKRTDRAFAERRTHRSSAYRSLAKYSPLSGTGYPAHANLCTEHSPYSNTFYIKNKLPIFFYRFLNFDFCLTPLSVCF